MTNNKSIRVTARAYPTMGLILLGGIENKKTRNPRYTTAAIAYTGPKQDIFVETTLYSHNGKKRKGMINGSMVDETSSRSPFRVIDKYSKIILKDIGRDPKGNVLSFNSNNYKILSGSSDAGAAAIGKCIAELCANDVRWKPFENELRTISESVGRSLYGGLTITPKVKGKAPYTEQLLDADAFKDYVIVACHFESSKRVSADEIHERIVKHKDYPKRILSAEKKGNTLRELAGQRNIEAIFDLAENDTHEWHGMLEDVGLKLITDEMYEYMERMKELRQRFWNRYLVVSGSNVFVFVRKEDSAKVVKEAKRYGASPLILKIARGAHIVKG